MTAINLIFPAAMFSTYDTNLCLIVKSREVQILPYLRWMYCNLHNRTQNQYLRWFPLSSFQFYSPNMISCLWIKAHLEDLRNLLWSCDCWCYLQNRKIDHSMLQNSHLERRHYQQIRILYHHRLRLQKISPWAYLLNFYYRAKEQPFRFVESKLLLYLV